MELPLGRTHVLNGAPRNDLLTRRIANAVQMDVQPGTRQLYTRFPSRFGGVGAMATVARAVQKFKKGRGERAAEERAKGCELMQKAAWRREGRGTWEAQRPPAAESAALLPGTAMGKSWDEMERAHGNTVSARGPTMQAVPTTTGRRGRYSSPGSVEDAEPEPEPEPEREQLVPMEELDETAVQAWLGTVPGLTAAQLAATRVEMAEDAYDGPLLVGATAKTLRRLLKGSDADEAAPALLAARDAYADVSASATAVERSRRLECEHRRSRDLEEEREVSPKGEEGSPGGAILTFEAAEEYKSKAPSPKAPISAEGDELDEPTIGENSGLASGRVQVMLERHFLQVEEDPSEELLTMFAAVAGAAEGEVTAWFAERRQRRDELASHAVRQRQHVESGQSFMKTRRKWRSSGAWEKKRPRTSEEKARSAALPEALRGPLGHGAARWEQLRHNNGRRIHFHAPLCHVFHE